MFSSSFGINKNNKPSWFCAKRENNFIGAHNIEEFTSLF